MEPKALYTNGVWEGTACIYHRSLYNIGMAFGIAKRDAIARSFLLKFTLARVLRDAAD